MGLILGEKNAKKSHDTATSKNLGATSTMAFTGTTLSAQLQYSTPELGRRERFRVFASSRI